MIGCARREHWSVIKYVYLVPVYWFMTSIAAVIALYQLVVKPHYWEKTNHGLHLEKAMPPAGEFTPARSLGFSKIFAKLPQSLWTGATALILAMSVTNLLNFLFNAFLGRALTLEQLAVVTLVNTIWSLVGMLLSAAGTTVNQRVAYLAAEGQMDEALSFRRQTYQRGLWVILGGSLLWLLSTPFLTGFFNLAHPWVILLFVPMFSFAFITVVNQGFLQGEIKLGKVGKIILFESIVKLLAAVGLVSLGLGKVAYLAIPISVVAVSVYAAWQFTKSTPKATALVSTESFSKSFYFFALFSGLSSVVFMNLDVLLVNHYLNPTVAGQYALLSLIGKMVYYFGSLPNALIVTFVSRDLGLNKNPIRTFYLLLGLTALFVGVIAGTMTIFGHIIIPILLGTRTIEILSFVPMYVLAMGLFTITTAFVTYHLARKQYVFPFASLLMSGLMAGLIIRGHGNILAVVNNMVYASVAGLGLVALMHLLAPVVSSMTNRRQNLFTPDDNKRFAGQKILIFNWRDRQHAYAGGAEVYIQELAKQWVLQGNQVTIFCGNDRQSRHREIIDGIEIVRRGGFYLVYVWAFVYYFAKFRGRFDVIIDCQNGIPFFTPLYVKEPVFCLMHHVHQEVFTRSLSRPLAALARFLEKDLMPLVYRNIRFITISNSSKAAIAELGLGQAGVDIVHPGVTLNPQAAFRKSPFPTILYLGRLKAYKSIDVLIKAFAIVVEKEPRARLIIAGSGEEEPNLKRLSRELGINPKVAFTGRVSVQEKDELLQKAWLFVNPSFMEGCGVTTV